jgi:hypothetical protein
MSYSEKLKLDTWSKRTQTNPILPASAGKIALSAVEGPVAKEWIPACAGMTLRRTTCYGGQAKCATRRRTAG